MITIRDMELEAQRGCNIFDAADQLRDYVYQRSEEAFGRARRSFPDRESVEKHAREVRSRFLEAIGGIPDAGYRKRKERDGGCPDRVTGVISCGDYSIEKVIFASAEHVLVSANLYLPAGCRQDLAAVLLVCGHDPEGKQAAEYQRACIRLVQAGLAVLVMDSFGQGERASYYDAEVGTERVGRCTREHDYAGFPCMLAGDSAARYLIRDAYAAVDYLETRPEIDASRIGITGNSGGGTLTLMTMLADPRLKAAAPGTFVTSRKAYLRSGQAQDNEQIWQGLTEAGIDHADILMCLAPKPVLLLTAAHDFFPQKGTESTFEICSRIWRMYGRPEDLEFYRDDCMHTYSAGMAERAAEFFARRLKKEPGAEDKLSGGTKERRLRPAAAAEGIRLQPSAVLWCTKTGHLQTETGTESIFEQNRRRCLELIRERNARMTEEERRKETVRFLQEKIRKNRRPGKLYLRKVRKTECVLDLFCDSYIWEAQDGVINHGFLFYRKKGKHPVTVALWRQGCRNLTERYGWIRRTCAEGRAVLVLDITGMGMLEQRQFLSWTQDEGFYGARFRLNADLVWLGDSLMALGCFDLLRSLDAAEQMPEAGGEDIRLFTAGRYAFYGEIAALLDGRILGLEEENPPEPWTQVVRERYYDPTDMAAFVIPGILRYADIPDIRKWREENESNRK